MSIWNCSPTATPQGEQAIHRRKTNDLVGIRHVAVEVPTTWWLTRYPFSSAGVRERGLRIDLLGEDHIPEEITPYPYKFFYWIDPWGVQWEMEQGRPVGRVVKGIVG